MNTTNKLLNELTKEELETVNGGEVAIVLMLVNGKYILQAISV